MRKIELLAPAGSWESLEATVKAGADAVYLAGQQFGARKSAQNFTNEELIEAINYCHLRGVKVYLTVNTLLHDNELEALEPFLTPLYINGIDAFIIQDLGVFGYLRKLYPEVELHCSTQMALHQISDIRTVKELGASRVVLPREMHVNQIREIHDAVDIEIEAFVHGALCVSVSGQCLMSSMIGGRSGNRGSCAQSCRQKYKLVSTETEKVIASKDGDYLLSPRDLMTIDDLERLIESGITSLKIEGRMKGPEYAYAVTRAYRQAIDKIGDIEASKETMKRLFNRDFTQGFILGTENKTYISQETPGNRGILVAEALSYDKRNQEVQLILQETIQKGDDLQIRGSGAVKGGRVEYIRIDGKRVEQGNSGEKVIVNFKHEVSKGTPFYRTYDQALMKETQIQINDSERTTSVTAALHIKVGQPLKLSLTHESGIVIEVTSEQLAEKALKTPLAKERIIEQMTKMGGTPFRCEDVQVIHNGDETAPIKVLNQLRREGTDLLILELTKTWHREMPPQKIEAETLTGENTSVKMMLTAMVRTYEQFRGAAELGVKMIYVHNLFENENSSQQTWQDGWKALFEAYPEVEVIPYLGRFQWEQEHRKNLEALSQFKDFTKMLVSTIGQVHTAKDIPYEPIADFSLNCFNHEAAKVLLEQGSRHMTLSLELNDEEINQLVSQTKSDAIDFELIGYGKIPVMVNKYCPINGVFSQSKEGCQICRKGSYYLEDKTGARFLVKGDANCQVEIFNSAVLNLADEWEAIESLGVKYYRLNFVDENYDEVVEVIETHIKSALGMIPELRGRGYTKGHFKRGVQ